MCRVTCRCILPLLAFFIASCSSTAKTTSELAARKYLTLRYPAALYGLEPGPKRPVCWLAYDDSQRLREIPCPAISRCHPGTLFYCATIDTWPTIVAVNEKLKLPPVILEEPFQIEPSSFFICFFTSMKVPDEQTRSKVADELAGLIQVSQHCSSHVFLEKKESIPPPPSPLKNNCIARDAEYVYYYEIMNGSNHDAQVKVVFGSNGLRTLQARKVDSRW